MVHGAVVQCCRCCVSRCQMPRWHHHPPTQTARFLKPRLRHHRPISSSRALAALSRGVGGHCGWRRNMPAGSKCRTRWWSITTRGLQSVSCARNCSRVFSDRVYNVKVGNQLLVAGLIVSYDVCALSHDKVMGSHMWANHIMKPHNWHDLFVIIVKHMTMFMVLSSWHSHWESSPGSFDEYRTAPGGCWALDQANQLEPQICLYVATVVSTCMHCRHLLVVSSKADTYFTILCRVNGWVNLSGW